MKDVEIKNVDLEKMFIENGRIKKVSKKFCKGNFWR